MKIKFFQPVESDESIQQRFSLDELAEYGLMSVAEEDADFIVCARIAQLIPYLVRHGSNKAYCLWCDEPLWTNFDSQPPVSQKQLFFGPDGKIYKAWVRDSLPIQVMNCYTGDVLISNYHFLNSGYHLDEDCLKYISSGAKGLFSDNLKPEDKKIIALLTYRNNPAWDFKSDDLDTISLCNLRSELGLDGAIKGNVVIYGRNWPDGISKGDTRFDDNRWAKKLEITKGYFFTLCIENCVVPNYVTEKIWHAISAGSLPIYYAGAKHSIYRDFPRDSFIDYADFATPAACWDFVLKMTACEYYRRLRLCVDALQASLNLSDHGRTPRRLQLCALRDRLRLNFYAVENIPLSNCIGEINWLAILANSNPVILDIGSNDGGTAQAFITAMPDAKIFAFEPDPRAIARFKVRKEYNSKMRSQVELFEGVLSDSIGEVDFYQSDGKNPGLEWYASGWDLSGSIRKPLRHCEVVPTIIFERKIKVTSITLDEWCQGKGLGLIDLAWIDVQGAESNVIRGALNTLSRIRYIYIEYSNIEMYDGQLNLDNLLKILPTFEVIQVYPNDVLLKNINLK